MNRSALNRFADHKKTPPNSGHTLPVPSSKSLPTSHDGQAPRRLPMPPRATRATGVLSGLLRGFGPASRWSTRLQEKARQVASARWGPAKAGTARWAISVRIEETMLGPTRSDFDSYRPGTTRATAFVCVAGAVFVDATIGLAASPLDRQPVPFARRRGVVSGSSRSAVSVLASEIQYVVGARTHRCPDRQNRMRDVRGPEARSRRGCDNFSGQKSVRLMPGAAPVGVPPLGGPVFRIGSF